MNRLQFIHLAIHISIQLPIQPTCLLPDYPHQPSPPVHQPRHLVSLRGQSPPKQVNYLAKLRSISIFNDSCLCVTFLVSGKVRLSHCFLSCSSCSFTIVPELLFLTLFILLLFFLFFVLFYYFTVFDPVFSVFVLFWSRLFFQYFCPVFVFTIFSFVVFI